MCGDDFYSIMKIIDDTIRASSETSSEEIPRS